MGDVKKWSVTYTKHLKQKRKVYHDGFLELQSSNHKAMLYDDCEKLLGIKILKNDDDVKTGETLPFDSYLVDIGDPHGDYKPIPKLNTKLMNKKVPVESGLLHSGKSSAAVDNRKSNLGKRKATPSNLSPSQKIIREFKKSEVCKYGSSPGYLDTTKSSTEEWQVLYTTQITQKAKKFHDGYLRLVMFGSHGKQIMLYDATRRLLDNRFLKKDERIMSGQSVTFDGHLVEIGESEEDQKPPKDIRPQGKHITDIETREPVHGDVGVHNKFPAGCLNKIQLEFKKSEVRKYSSSPGSLDMTKSSTEEWQVLYTTQITQKAKKFHDGILRLVMSGSHGKQIMLYDATRRLLVSRFLKKNESIGSGESVTFDGYLVDIGECEGDQKPLKDISPREKHIKELGKRGPVQGEVAVLNKLLAEWDAMYTTQITQKAKKYNNGILRLSSFGSHQSQVTLLTEEGNILCRKFLKLSEHVTTGTTLNLSNYLVEVGDMRTSPEGKPQTGASSREHAQSDFKISGLDHIKLSRRISSDKPLPNTFSVEHMDSKTASCSVDKTMNCRISRTNSVRAAHEILSILKKPITSKGASTVRDITFAEECQVLQSSSLVCSDIKSQTEEHLLQDFNVKGSSPLHREEQTTMTHSSGRNISEIKVTDASHLDDISQSSDCTGQRVSHTQSLSLSTVLGEMDICLRDVECIVTERPPTAKLKHLVIPESDYKIQAVETLCHDRSNKISETEDASESVSQQDNPSGSVAPLTDVCTLTHASNKPAADNKQMDTQWQEGFSGVIADASNDFLPQFLCHSTEMNSVHDISTYKMDDLPSFDLGF
ncbi:uncharacterized protein LOC107792351 isoform X2 [Nicotiana tabacum]|uniref:Uncharacterized protein LOC107792351 isoform X2 n=1 Tax=Nicotiana tabacum TaxID=4097 RepID=A0A1S4A0F7_TOBAC|nr:PREDICTED: uncharacterized protein LOC107792351 isoform X2 [Nicotiana tabacum]